MTRAGLIAILFTALIGATAATASAEPKFLSQQYPRCTNCHISPTGGGLLSRYRRSLSHVELSTFNAPAPQNDEAMNSGKGEQAFLFGAFGDKLGPVQLGVSMRPSRLQYSVLDTDTGRNLLMNADLMGAYTSHDWTVYGEIGREPLKTGSKIDSYEYWVGRQPQDGLGFRVGRFLPAYGVHFADHTSYNRAQLGLTQYDQIYGVELSASHGRYLTQVSLGPGSADAIIDDANRAEFTATARLQTDLTPRMVIATSGLYRNGSD